MNQFWKRFGFYVTLALAMVTFVALAIMIANMVNSIPSRSTQTPRPTVTATLPPMNYYLGWMYEDQGIPAMSIIAKWAHEESISIAYGKDESTSLQGYNVRWSGKTPDNAHVLRIEVDKLRIKDPEFGNVLVVVMKYGDNNYIYPILVITSQEGETKIQQLMCPPIPVDIKKLNGIERIG